MNISIQQYYRHHFGAFAQSSLQQINQSCEIEAPLAQFPFRLNYYLANDVATAIQSQQRLDVIKSLRSSVESIQN